MASWGERLRSLLRRQPVGLARVEARVVDELEGGQASGYGTSGWSGSNLYEVQEAYKDALIAWRKNPMAKRIIDVTTDFCLGDGLTPYASGPMGDFIARWWNHPKNKMEMRLPEIVDELSRAGDVFITLHRNPEDGISYVRPIPKDRIGSIRTLPNDWETELSFVELRQGGLEQVEWLSPYHPEASVSDAVMVHYKVNGVVGASLGESDLATLIPWLQRYSRMLEDRIRLHWALKAFLWIVTVPSNLVQAKREQYAAPPEGGAVIVKDAQEDWQPVTPDLHGFDAGADLRAVRLMIDAGASTPPHWRFEPTDVSLATATAMERAATRHLKRRQLYLREMVIDLAHLAYCRAYEIGRAPKQRGGAMVKPDRTLIECPMADLSRQDNRELGLAAQNMAQAMATLVNQVAGLRGSRLLVRRVIDLVLRFAGEAIEPAELDAIVEELEGRQEGPNHEDTKTPRS